MALGAFLGGMIVGRSELSHQAAADALPLRDAFAVLFFVSVGMLFEPRFLLERPLLILATLGIILLVKPVSALLITLFIGFPTRTGLTVGAGLGQIGEFSFIVGGLGQQLGILPHEATQAIVAAALISIALNPAYFLLVDPIEARLRGMRSLSRWVTGRAGELARVPAGIALNADGGHVVLCGHGRSGRVIGRMLRERKMPMVVIEQDRAIVLELRSQGVAAIHGDAANELILERSSIDRARLLLITLADPMATRQAIEAARRLSPGIEIVARVDTEAERHHLSHRHRVAGVLAELELAIEMSRHTLQRFGVSQIEAQAVALDMRRGVFAPRDRARVVEVRIAPDSKAAGRQLAELALGKGILVMAIDRNGDLLVPDGQTRIEVGDLVLLLTSGELTDHVREVL
jgi:CPA2 family monovalent cation:H+ antiporter-2